MLLALASCAACSAPRGHHPAVTDAPAAVVGPEQDHARADARAPSTAIIRLGAIEVDREAAAIRVPGSVALREGWLEQAICRVGSREHESLVSVEMPPSAVHAAMLLAGLKPGAPGRWRVRDDGSLELVPPTGERVDVEVEWTAADGRPMRSALTEWITTPKGAPPIAFVFSGSVTREAAAVPYAADQSGSVVGLVTFGDEPIASVAVVPDRAEVAEPSLLARSERIPAEGTPVTIMIRRAAPAR